MRFDAETATHPVRCSGAAREIASTGQGVDTESRAAEERDPRATALAPLLQRGIRLAPVEVGIGRDLITRPEQRVRPRQCRRGERGDQPSGEHDRNDGPTTDTPHHRHDRRGRDAPEREYGQQVAQPDGTLLQRGEPGVHERG